MQRAKEFLTLQRGQASGANSLHKRTFECRGKLCHIQPPTLSMSLLVQTVYERFATLQTPLCVYCFFALFRFFIHLGLGTAFQLPCILEHKPALEIWCVKLKLHVAGCGILLLTVRVAGVTMVVPSPQLSAPQRVY
jgi:hypothetical protein